MKLMILVAVVAGVIGAWAGFNSWQSGPVTTTIHSALSVLIGGNMLMCSWAWWRAKPGSGDATVMTTLMLLSGAILLGILPRLFWPTNDGRHLVGSISSALIVTVIAVVQIRNRRRLGGQSKPV
jgi:hypothetical protein